ncbi:AraC-like DNA-binding protein [Arthrobacter stackebrandtii]|uniref:AraC-like DNA-binding protein n=1 Tax=Arthrobacter stackebrandtii TaxID=272161 RepID=A0ABS4YSG0_9MICC|nr:helix-turn-helix domain-containing protein [Arthrobacter stackebrandtii]MBP2411540.1 AraC-like DNA-binding protein [Arthrobacter stackebrandtii]PYG99224.1 hypothetical protein CVV67_15965 [Arthrobacter stackebrandtii]
MHLPRLTPNYDLNLRLGSGQHCTVVGIDFGATAVTALHLQAGECTIAADDRPDDTFSLVFVVDGELALLSPPGEPPVKAGRGDVWAFSRTSNFDVAVAADAQLVAVSLPAQVLRDFGVGVIHGMRGLDPESAMLSPVLGFLREVALTDVDTTSVASYFMEKLVHEMVGGIMLENRGARFVATRRKGIFDQAMDYIAARAGDGALTPELLARELSVSLRQLQREFKSHNASIAVVILQHRVDLSILQLKDPLLDVLTIDQVAVQSGFSSVVQMRRALRDACAGTPTEIRDRAREQRRAKQPA